MTPYYMGIWTPSRADIDLDADAALARQARELRGDHEILHRHSLGLEERDLVRRGPAGTCRR
jgi:hypothetical protein